MSANGEKVPSIDRPSSIVPDDGSCQDCGETDFKRRSRCDCCGLLLCWWCYSHEHKMTIGEGLGCRGVHKIDKAWSEFSEWVRLTAASGRTET